MKVRFIKRQFEDMKQRKLLTLVLDISLTKGGEVIKCEFLCGALEIPGKRRKNRKGTYISYLYDWTTNVRKKEVNLYGSSN